MDRLTQKVAGLPVIVWGLIVGLLVIVVMYWQRSRSAISGAATPSATTLPDISNEGLPAANTNDNIPDFTTPFQTNDTWVAQAIAKLGGEGVAPLRVQQVLQAYLKDGTILDEGLVNRALTLLGPAPASPTIQAPPSPPGPVTIDSVQSHEFRASWAAANEATLYEYQVEGYPVHTTTSTSVRVTGVYPGRPFVFKVRAKGPGGRWSTYSTGSGTTPK